MFKRGILNILIILMFTVPVLGFEVVSDQDRMIEQLIIDGIEDYHSARFEEALVKFRRIQNLRPQHPAGYVYEAGALNFIMSDLRNYKWEDEFHDLIKKSIDLSKKMIDHDLNDPWGYFYLGASYGFRGVASADREKWVRAFLDGNLGFIQFTKVEEMDPTIYDIYYGLGTYHYWRGEKGKVFKWLKIFPGEKELGLDQLDIAIKKGKYSQVEGESSLLRILVHEQKYVQAVELADDIISRYPGYLYCYRYKSTALLELGRFDDAVENHEQIIEIVRDNPYSVKYTIMEAETELLNILVKKGDLTLAKEYGEKLYSQYRVYRHGREGNKLKEIKQILENLN